MTNPSGKFQGSDKTHDTCQDILLNKTSPGTNLYKNQGVQAMAWRLFGDIQSYLEPFIVIWSNFEQFSVIWRHLELFGAIGSHLKLFGTMLSYLKQFQAIWSVAIWVNLDTLIPAWPFLGTVLSLPVCHIRIRIK